MSAQTAKPRRAYITINPTAFATLGVDPDTAKSVETQELILRQAAIIRRAALAVEPMFARGEWLLLADATNGLLWDAGLSAKTAIRLEVEAHDHDNRIGEKWSVNVDDLLAKLNSLDEIEAEAVAIALRWFWDHHETIDMTEDRWWTVAFRTRAAKGGG